MRRLLPLVAVLLAASAAAQVNTERMRRALDTDTVMVSVDANTAFATGNTNYFQLGVGGRTDFRVGDDLAFLVGRLDLAETDEAAFIDRWFAHARYNRTILPSLIGEAFVQIERNRQQRLDSRTLFGAGTRYELVNADSLGLALGVTPMLEFETLEAELGGDQDAVVRVSSYLSGRVTLPGGSQLTAVAYLQPRADKPGDLRVLGQAALDVRVTEHLLFRTRFNLRVDSRPPETVERTDVALENGLVLVFSAD